MSVRHLFFRCFGGVPCMGSSASSKPLAAPCSSASSRSRVTSPTFSASAMAASAAITKRCPMSQPTVQPVSSDGIVTVVNKLHAYYEQVLLRLCVLVQLESSNVFNLACECTWGKENGCRSKLPYRQLGHRIERIREDKRVHHSIWHPGRSRKPKPHHTAVG